MPPIQPPIETPISERTKAIMEGLKHLQDVSHEMREIRRLLEMDHTQKEGLKAALKRAINQLISQW